MPFPTHLARGTRRLLPLIAVAILLAACGGGENEPDPTPTAEPVSTATAGELSVGDLVSRVEEAWPSARSVRTTSTSGPVPTDEPDATTRTGIESTVEEAIAPDARRIVRMTDGVVTDEEIWVNGMVYMWGSFVGSAVAPEVGPATWITVDPSVVPQDTPVGYRLAYLMRSFEHPFGEISAETRALPATEAGQAQVGGRTCTVYTFANATTDGTPIQYELAIDDQDLPCQIVLRAEGFQNSSVYEVNIEGLEIIAPDTPSTPVSGTPEG